MGCMCGVCVCCVYVCVFSLQTEAEVLKDFWRERHTDKLLISLLSISLSPSLPLGYLHYSPPRSPHPPVVLTLIMERERGEKGERQGRDRERRRKREREGEMYGAKRVERQGLGEG